MDNVSIVGIDLAKQSFQLNGALPDGSGVFCKRLSRPQLLAFLAEFLIAVLRWRLRYIPLLGA
jgi:transposase